VGLMLQRCLTRQTPGFPGVRSFSATLPQTLFVCTEITHGLHRLHEVRVNCVHTGSVPAPSVVLVRYSRSPMMFGSSFLIVSNAPSEIVQPAV